jgi:hypothetical protein
MLDLVRNNFGQNKIGNEKEGVGKEGRIERIAESKEQTE